MRTGIKVGEAVIASLKNFNPDLKYCVEITTNGCLVMVSEVRGAVAKIKDESINAVFCPCYNHVLNLSILQTLKVKAISNAVNIMKEAINFLDASLKTSYEIKKILGHELSDLCETKQTKVQATGTLLLRSDTLMAIFCLSDFLTYHKIRVVFFSKNSNRR